MNFQKHCPGCFRRKDQAAVCPHCGFDESLPRSPLFLPYGAMLSDQYRVGKVLGRPGGFGVTYLGWDVYLQQKVAIKEYLPPDMAARIPESLDITVHSAEDRNSFEHGKEQFLREARTVARLDHPNVVRVRTFFNANDSAYMVMDYYEGLSLDEYFKHVSPTLAPNVAMSLTQMMLDGLSYVHQHGLVHRDVKPHNIYLAAIGKPILLDFGAARKAAIAGQHKSISVVLTEGYAPLEQYQRNGVQGPWTDVYGMAATLYRMIVGVSPPPVLDRLTNDALEQTEFAGIPDELKPIMSKAMALHAPSRYQSAGELRNALQAIAGNPVSTQPDSLSSVAQMATAPYSTYAEPSALLPETTSFYTQNNDALPASASQRASTRVRVAPEVIQAALQPIPIAPAPTRGPVDASNAAPPVITPHPPVRAPAAIPPAEPTPIATPQRSKRLVFALIATVAAAGVWALVNSQEHAPAKPVRSAAAPTDNKTPRTDLPKSALPEMVVIPAGSSEGEGAQAFSTKGFAMAATEVTVEQFNTFVERSGYQMPSSAEQPCAGGLTADADWRNPGFVQTDTHPAVCVSWVDAQAYVQWLSSETNTPYRLPTSFEWGYAAAANTNTPYWWGSYLDKQHAWCSDCDRSALAPSKPWLVSSLGRNPWGLLGTASNVREWTCSTEQGPADQCNADAGNLGIVVRGGSWRDNAVALQARTQFTDPATTRNTWTGFRVLRVNP